MENHVGLWFWLDVRYLLIAFYLGLLICAPVSWAGENVVKEKTVQEKLSRRIALVIGNADYKPSLKNSLNDARSMAASLKKLGFNVVYKENLDFPGMLKAAENFITDARDGDVRLFYYSGHGLQMYDRNYLVPIGIKLSTDDEVVANTLDVTGFIDNIGNFKKGVNIVILDTCRYSPVIATRTLRGRGMNSIAGLASTSAPRGTIVAFATGRGGKALDGDKNSTQSVYTKHLLKWIETPGLPVDDLFKQVRTAVVLETDGEQQPWDAVNIIGQFCLRNDDNGQCGN